MTGRLNTWVSRSPLLDIAWSGKTYHFAYGADGLRRNAEVRDATTNDLISSTTYVLDGQNVVQEWSGQQLAATYLPGLLGPACRIDEVTDAGLWFLYDAHGNVLGEVDEQGRVNYGLSPYDLSQSPVPPPHETPLRAFDPWGFVNNRDDVAVSANPLKYCGSLDHPSESANGLIYMRARYYDPLLGRFISEDPAKDGGNWYAYAGNNPVGNVDPNGRAPSPATLATQAALLGFSIGFSASLGFAVATGDVSADALASAFAVSSGAAGAVYALAYVMSEYYGTPSFGNYIPQRIGLGKAVGLASGAGFVGGLAAGVTFEVCERAGEAAWWLLVIEKGW